MLTSHDAVAEKIQHLNMGVDDYWEKSMNMLEVQARIENIALHLEQQLANNVWSRLNNHWVLDCDIYKIVSDANRRMSIELSSKEFQILKLLLRTKDKISSREEIVEKVWGEGHNCVDKNVDVQISHLRKKLSRTGLGIRAFRGLGYQLYENPNHIES